MYRNSKVCYFFLSKRYYIYLSWRCSCAIPNYNFYVECQVYNIWFLNFQESILLWQRKCEDALYSLLVLGARRPVRHLASVTMARIIMKGDGISIYSRASSLQGFLSDGKKSEPLRVAG